MNGFALNNISDCYIGSNQVSAVYLGSTKIYPSTPPHDYSQDYLTIEAISNTYISFITSKILSIDRTVDVSRDNGQTWTSIRFLQGSWDGGSPTEITLHQGDKMLIKGNNTSYAVLDEDAYHPGNIEACYFDIYVPDSSGGCKVYGNIMSLIYGDNFIGQTSLTAPCTFSYLFNGHGRASVIIKDASNLILPATTLTKYCYRYMFMHSMFDKAPILPATTLKDYCYANMFSGCTHLNYIKCLANDISATNCTSDWLYDVSATGTFIKDVNTTWPSSDDGIPSNWTIQNA